MATKVEEIDLYEVLEIERGASKEEVRKAYRKQALKHHPDKAAEEDREAADVKFKAVSEAYDILYDDDKRGLYDEHGMAAFAPRSGMGGAGGGSSGMDMDMDEIIAEMLRGMGGMPGMDGMGGMPGMGGFAGMGGGGGGMGGGAKRRRRGGRGQDEVTQYEVSLEEMYRGKTARFHATRQIPCGQCRGSGGREGTAARECSSCQGSGSMVALQPRGPPGGGMVSRAVECSVCHGTGTVRRDKDRCRRCRGRATVSDKQPVELRVPRGARDDDRIVLAGLADQHPGQTEPGDLVFVLKQKEHPTFTRNGADLAAAVDVGLAEALTGFDRVLLTHLDGRGLSLALKPGAALLRPGQVLRVAGEGMPLKRQHASGDARGDLFLTVNVIFPDDAWLRSMHDDSDKLARLAALLPPAPPAPKPAGGDDAVVDEVDYDPAGSMGDFGANEGREEGDDDDGGDDEMGGQCAQQ